MAFHNSFRLLGVAALMAGVAVTVAQDAPFAVGPKHPLAKPLSPSDRFGTLPDSVLRITTPVEPRDVHEGAPLPGGDRIVDHNPITGVTTYPSRSNTTTPGTFVNGFLGFTSGAWLSEPTGGDNRISIQTVIGPDQRVRINPTTGTPWRTVVKLYMRWGTRNFIGSGIMIGNKYVLTAGHCVHDRAMGGWASAVRAVPAQNGSSAPFGSAWATRFRSYTGWTNSKDSNYDIALITLDRTVGNSTGWMGYASLGTVNGITGNSAGYPGDRDGGANMYYTTGPITSSTSLRIFYKFDTAGGQSGSGVWRLLSGQRHVFGVHTTGSASLNGGTRITTQRFNDIRAWIASGI